MPYIQKITKQYPVSEADIKAANPNTSFANPFVAPDEYALVFPAPQLPYNSMTQTIREIEPYKTAKGNYEQQWEVTDLASEQIETIATATLASKRTTLMCSPRQIRQALTAAGLREAVEAGIAGGDQNIKDWYQFATDFQRLHPSVLLLASALQVTDTQLDNLFELAVTL